MSTDPTIYVCNKSSQVSDADMARATAACAKQLVQHVAPAHGLVPVAVTFTAKPPLGARVITVMNTLDDAEALGYHTIDGAEHIWGVVGTKVAMAQGAKALVGVYAISSILSHEVVEAFVDPFCAAWCDTGKGYLVAFEACDPVENDFYIVDGVAVSSFVTAEWFNASAAKGDRFDYMGRLKAPFTMTRGGYWVQSKAGRQSQKFGEGMPDWRRLAKKSEFSRSHRRMKES